MWCGTVFHTTFIQSSTYIVSMSQHITQHECYMNRCYIVQWRKESVCSAKPICPGYARHRSPQGLIIWAPWGKLTEGNSPHSSWGFRESCCECHPWVKGVTSKYYFSGLIPSWWKVLTTPANITLIWKLPENLLSGQIRDWSLWRGFSWLRHLHWAVAPQPRLTKGGELLFDWGSGESTGFPCDDDVTWAWQRWRPGTSTHCTLGFSVPKPSWLVSVPCFYSAVAGELEFDAITDKQCLIPSSQIPVATEEITKPVKLLGAAGPALL